METLMNHEQATTLHEFVGPAHEKEELRIYQACFFEEMPGLVFGGMTLIWIVTSLAALVW
jgi:hypothetical protein